jgi:hypothetical protein
VVLGSASTCRIPLDSTPVTSADGVTDAGSPPRLSIALLTSSKWPNSSSRMCKSSCIVGPPGRGGEDSSLDTRVARFVHVIRSCRKQHPSHIAICHAAGCVNLTRPTERWEPRPRKKAQAVERDVAHDLQRPRERPRPGGNDGTAGAPRNEIPGRLDGPRALPRGSFQPGADFMTNEGALICFPSLRYSSGFHRPHHSMR